MQIPQIYENGYNPFCNETHIQSTLPKSNLLGLKK